ncbi:MAG: type II secretion system protein GspD, partial [Candidatus Omnitrophica bacterium]|nr:type II secretion system protein GspD [Candidatus Omnitrophota bacterium]
KLREFLSYVQRNMPLQFQVGGDLIWVTDAKDPSKRLEETRFYQLREGLILPAQFGISQATKTTVIQNNVRTETETQKFENFVPDGAPTQPAIMDVINQFFTGKYQVDFERNVIVAQGTQDQLALLEKIIDNFDKPVQQVLIEARFITVTEAAFLQLGVAWETGRNPLTTGRTAQDYTGLAPNNVGLGLEESWFSVLGRKDLSATLTALDQSGESEVLSAPRLTLINNLPATISDGKIQYYYQQYTVQQTVLQNASTSSLVPDGAPTKLTSGVVLDVMASIGGDGKSILLALRPEINEDVQLVTFATVSDRDANGNIS